MESRGLCGSPVTFVPFSQNEAFRVDFGPRIFEQFSTPRPVYLESGNIFISPPAGSLNFHIVKVGRNHFCRRQFQFIS